MLQIGLFNKLQCLNKTEKGIFLDGKDHGELFLPNSQIGTPINVGDTIDLFVYQGVDGEIALSSAKPKVKVGEFASLTVKQVNKMGAFMDWGLPKDLLVPFNQQKKRMQQGKKYIVRAYLDARSQSLVASTRLDKFLNVWPAEFKEGQEVNLLIAGKTDLGFKAIVNNSHWGLLYQNEIFKPIYTGQSLKGFIKKVREDGLVDIRLNKTGKAKVNDFADDLMTYMSENNDECLLNDQSSPDEISQLFGVSKKTFKSTIGRLLKLNKIEKIDQGFKLKH